MTGTLGAALVAWPAAGTVSLGASPGARWGVLADVPVEPDADTARLWLKEELLDPVYLDDPSLLARFLDWLSGLFDDVRVLDVNPVVASAVIVGLVLVVAAIAYVVAGPVRVSRRARASVAVFEDDERSAADLRAAADSAAAAGDWGTAVVERYRAVVRSLEERVLLDPRPGRTAHEAAAAAALRLPALTDRLGAGARLFDDVRYGKVSVGPAADQALRELDAAVLATRPTPLVPPDGPTGSGGPDQAGPGTAVPGTPVAVTTPLPTDQEPTATGGAR